MRKIDELTYTAVLHGEPFRKDNTSVVVKDFQHGCLEETVLTVNLFGNEIARIVWKGRPLAKRIDWAVSTCGWATNTTCARLNAVLKAIDGGVTCHVRREEMHFYVDGRDAGAWGTFTMRNLDDIRKGGSHEG